MVKRYTRLLVGFYVITDAIAAAVAFLVAYWLRFTLLPVPKGMPPLEQYVNLLPFVVILTPLAFQIQGAYRLRRGRSRVDDFFAVLVGTIVAVVLAAGADINGDTYEELLERSAGDTKTTAGQYFTPRPLIEAIVDVVQPTVADRVVDPACGSGGFLLAAHAHASRDAAALTPPEREHLRTTFVRGVDIGPTTSRLASMNLLLHGLGSITGDSLVDQKDALIADPGERWSVVLANPPFGRSSSTDISNGSDDGTEIFRQDFVVTTSNKQLNFLQHIMTILDINGRAGVVLPDNVLFEGGAGETLRRKLLTAFDFHTLLRLPTGIFYKPGVKANVLFFDKKPAAEQPWTQRLWVYDLRTNKHFTLKKKPLRRDDLDDFVSSYLPGRPHDERAESERWKSFSYDELVARDKVNLDITWLRDESLEDADDLPAPDVIAREIVEDLTAALAEFEAVAAALERQSS